MAEGFLEITKILVNGIEVYPTTNSISTYSGDNIIIAIYIKNTGATDNFYCQVRDLDTFQVWGVQNLYNFSAGSTALIPELANFTMPNRSLNLAIISYHDEFGTWKRDNLHSFVISLIVAEGFLEILGVTAPESAHVGDEIGIIIHTQNIGGADDFRIELINDIIDSTEFYLEAGLTKDAPFSFIMPDKDVTITVNTYHWEETGFALDSTISLNVNRKL